MRDCVATMESYSTRMRSRAHPVKIRGKQKRDRK
jgi:hypothetical protein